MRFGPKKNNGSGRVGRLLCATGLCLTGALGLASCATYADVEPRQTALPDYATFAAVSPALEAHCGSLDCHGQQRRNFRLYGWNGIRLPSEETPPDTLPPGTVQQPDLVPGFGQTTEEELWENYISSVLLEPEKTSIVLYRGVGVEELLLVSKGRGREHHKGEVAMVAGDPTDRCVVSWLLGAVDTVACTESLATASVPPDFSQ